MQLQVETSSGPLMDELEKPVPLIPTLISLGELDFYVYRLTTTDNKALNQLNVKQIKA